MSCSAKKVFRHNFLDYEYEHDVCDSMQDRALRCIAWFWLFSVQVLSPPRRTVLVLVIDCLNRLEANAISKHLKIFVVGTFTRSVSQAPFEYEYHFVEYEYEYDEIRWDTQTIV